ncbi:hypothetical protein DdX_11608 [Ditylenchus destructor]|uniref:Uncharacterized protein n=1 Tax=Ditylenchus destructor TaxID=166010 RepID=A0AAD4MYH7_9BILA|nr:hypothetical protein DdX_11608 [Ditylenchus destructor]
MYGPFGGFNQFTNPMLYGGGGAMMGNPLLAMDYGASMGGMNGFLGGLNPMLGANGFGMNSFGLMNPTDPMMGSNLGSGLSMGNPIFGTATNSNNFGSVGSPFGRQFRRYSSGGIGRDSEANKSPTPGCGFLMKRGCNDVNV